MPPPCGEPKCRAYHLTVNEFQRLGGQSWAHGFNIKLSLRAKKLYIELYGKEPPQVRANQMRGDRNKVGQYPCGILEQAYRQLMSEGTGNEHPLPRPTLR